MKRLILIGLVLYCALNVAGAEGIERSAKVKRAFAKEHPCPVTGKPVPHCPGYVIDHKQPLCASGDDAVDNMQWQTIEAAKAKDRIEYAYCACLRKHGRDACAWWP